MPDITMCTNESCDRKYECYRYMAKPKKFMQSYSEFKNSLDLSSMKCKMFVFIDRYDLLDAKKVADKIKG